MDKNDQAGTAGDSAADQGAQDAAAAGGDGNTAGDGGASTEQSPAPAAESAPNCTPQ